MGKLRRASVLTNGHGLFVMVDHQKWIVSQAMAAEKKTSSSDIVYNENRSSGHQPVGLHLFSMLAIDVFLCQRCKRGRQWGQGWRQCKCQRWLGQRFSQNRRQSTQKYAKVREALLQNSNHFSNFTPLFTVFVHQFEFCITPFTATSHWLVDAQRSMSE